MTHAQLIAAMLQTARPVIEHYWTDIAHDAETIAKAEPGDVFLWAPVPCGTRLVCLWRGDRPNDLAQPLCDAINGSGAPAQWFRIVIGGDDSHGLNAVAAHAAAEECRSATETARTPGRESVSQAHL